MKDKCINAHKQLAMTGTVPGYASGGHVGSKVKSVSVRHSGKAANPLRAAKAMNGIPGHKKGGGV